jgi:HPr kinase/phosphorylase
VHGTLIDINGIGTLIRGDSGIGKSECALGLIDHGHSLVADDHVNCVKVNDHIILGKSNDLNRGYMECRGIGIINVAELFGIRRVRVEKSIDIVVTFIEWKPGVVEERTGLEINYFEILGANCCENCDGGSGIKPISELKSIPPYHPNCGCMVVYYIDNPEEE